MKITGFRLLSGGVRGIEVEGYELTGMDGMNVSFNDKVRRTRNFPLTYALRDSIAALKYPVLVGTKHWRNEYAEMMTHDFSGIKKDINLLSGVGKELNGIWNATQIEKVTSNKGTYKIHAKVVTPIGVLTAVVVIDPDNEYSLYSLVSDILHKVVGIIDQTLNLPKLTYNDTGMVRKLVREISNDDADELADELSPEEAFLAMMSTASKKGYSVVMDNNLLAQLELQSDAVMAVGDGSEEAILKGESTMDESIFIPSEPDMPI